MTFEALLASPAVAEARARIRALAQETVRTQLQLVEIPAPSLAEAARAAFVQERFNALAAGGARGDAAGNVALPLAGGRPGEAPVVVAAHLDTVFAAETVLAPEHRAGRYWAPGITDNARGVAAMLTLARVLTERAIRTTRPVHLVATVGEEGAGDLRGVKHLFRPDAPLRRAHAVIALDGSGVRRIVHRAVGSRRLRFQFTGPGGHSWTDWGVANPVGAVGSAVHALRGLKLSTDPPASLTVARVGGGSSINAIPAEGWMELDLRSEDPALLRALEERVREVVQDAVRRENGIRRAGSPALAVSVQLIGDRPAGATPAEHPLVRSAMAATRAVGAQPELVSSSTDANAPIACGIAAVAIGAGGRSGGIHTLQEWYDDTTGADGLERALLLLLAAAGVEG